MFNCRETCNALTNGITRLLVVFLSTKTENLKFVSEVGRCVMADEIFRCPSDHLYFFVHYISPYASLSLMPVTGALLFYTAMMLLKLLCKASTIQTCPQA